MPTYQYRCSACDHRFEAVQKFTDASLTECPECGGDLRKVYGSVGVVFKGDGFYRNDARAGKSAGKSDTGKADTGKADAAGKPDTAAKEGAGPAKASAAGTSGAAGTSTSTGSAASSGSASSSSAGGSSKPAAPKAS